VDLEGSDIIKDFETFLHERGLVLQERLFDQETFGNSLLQCGNGVLAVRVVSDRGVCSITVAESEAQPRKWYDAALLRDLLVGQGDDVLPLVEQIEFLRKNWDGVVQCLASERREESRKKLVQLGLERVRRRIPGLL